MESDVIGKLSLFSPHFLQVFDLHAHVDSVLKAADKHSLANVLSPCLTESTTHDSAVFMQPREQELYQALIKSPDLRVKGSTVSGQEALSLSEGSDGCEGFFYFDDLHPATVVHKLIAKQIDLYIRKHYSPVLDASDKFACDLQASELTENTQQEGRCR